MTSAFIYEILSPILFLIFISFLLAEFIGRSKHIGRAYSFFMLLGIFPGILGLIFSPSAKKENTKPNRAYFVLAIFLTISFLYGFYKHIDDFNWINIFSLISLFTSAEYCYQLGKGNIINLEPKYYFEKEKKSNFNITITNLTDLKNKGILSNEEYEIKLKNLVIEKEKYDIENSIEYKQLKNLYNNKVLNEEEFDDKIKLLYKLTKKKIDSSNHSKTSIENINKINRCKIKGKIYEIKDLEDEIKNGRLELWRNTIIEMEDGRETTLEFIPELYFLIEIINKYRK